MGDVRVNRRDLATRLSALVALSGLLPIGIVGAFAIEVQRRRSEQASEELLRAVAQQAGERIATFVAQQRVLLRTLAAAVEGEPDIARRLEEAPLDAPALAHVSLVDARTPGSALPPAITSARLAEALSGHEVASPTYLAGLSPAMDVCVPAGSGGGRAVCATLDLLELQREVQRIRIGESGYALAFDSKGRLLAAGSGTLRAAVLTGENVPETPAAIALALGNPAPPPLEDRIAGWTWLPQLGWSIAIEQSAGEAMRAAHTAQLTLGLFALLALAASILVGATQARRVLTTLEVEERWRTAGLIATGISHDLGHRLVILQQTAALAEEGDPAYLPRIRDSLASEVSTLRKFVTDFADLTREAKPTEFLPLELNAFAESVRRSASSHAVKHRVTLEVRGSGAELWVRADRYLLERATLNLVYNAIEASKIGDAVVLAVARTQLLAQLSIADRGTGIEAERLPRLFDAFASTKRTGAHIGVGLPNVQRILRAHGGEVSVVSEPGAGSTFTMALPLPS